MNIKLIVTLALVTVVTFGVQAMQQRTTRTAAPTRPAVSTQATTAKPATSTTQQRPATTTTATSRARTQSRFF